VPGGDPFRDNGRFGVFADVDHLGAGIRLLMAAGQRHREKLTDGVIAAQNAARVFPGDEPVSDWVQDILLFSPSHSARLVTKFRIPPVLLSPGTSSAPWSISPRRLYG
jgi:hypothetical protein